MWMFLPSHLMYYTMMLNNLLILILSSLSMPTLKLTCLTSCWTASVKALSRKEILLRRVQLRSADINVKMKCFNFSLGWRCKTSTSSSKIVLFLGGNHQLTNSRILNGLLSSILQFLLHLLHLSVSGAEFQESSQLNKAGCRRSLLLQ